VYIVPNYFLTYYKCQLIRKPKKFTIKDWLPILQPCHGNLFSVQNSRIPTGWPGSSRSPARILPLHGQNGRIPDDLDLVPPRSTGLDLATPRPEQPDSDLLAGETCSGVSFRPNYGLLAGETCSRVSFRLDSGLLAVETWSGVSLESESAERGMDLVFLGL
jgi:hypothetical protein